MPPRATAGRAVAATRAAALALVALASAGVLLSSEPAGAQERRTLIRVLESAHDFRARVRAAIALGSTHDHDALAPLSTALAGDDNAAVRAACASALGTLGDAEALPALRGAMRDASADVRTAVQAAIRALIASRGSSDAAPEPAPAEPPASSGSSDSGSGSSSDAPRVDWIAAHWLVVMGSMENRTSVVDERLISILEHEVHGGLVVLRGVVLLDDDVPHTSIDAEARRRHVPELRVEGSIATIEERHEGSTLRVLCRTSVLVLDEPGRNIRAELSATAEATEDALSGHAREEQVTRLARRACEAAADHAIDGAARVLGSVH